MAKITITIPDDKINAVTNAFCDMFGYQEKIQQEDGTEIDNPISKAQFAKGKINDYIKEVFINSRVNAIDAQKTAIRETAVADTVGIITS